MGIRHVHPIKITFDIPVAPKTTVKRFVYAYFLDGDRPCLIDTGVAGAEKQISAALRKAGRNLSDIEVIVLTHSHPDHIGAASIIQRLSGAKVWAHRGELTWIEDVQKQAEDRPVPGFGEMVSGSVKVDRLLEDGDVVPLGDTGTLEVLHTPGHSSGSISLLSRKEGIIFCGDAIPQTGEMPIYEDVCALATSLVRLAAIDNLTALYSSWTEPLHGQEAAHGIRAGIHYLKTIHDVVMRADSECRNPDPMELCRRCVQALGLPRFALNPLVARSLNAHRQSRVTTELDRILAPFVKGEKYG